MTDIPFLTFRNILSWMGAWSLVGLAAMGVDKHLARSQEGEPRPHRISERALHEVALIGGFVGVIAGAGIFHHKTLKPSFWLPVLVSALLWVVSLALLAQNGFLRIII